MSGVWDGRVVRAGSAAWGRSGGRRRESGGGGFPGATGGGSCAPRSGCWPEIGEFQVGDRLGIAGSAGIIRAVEDDDGWKPKLILELLPHGA